MGYEIEIKAHIEDYQLLKEKLITLDGCQFLGEEKKDDVYWSKGNGEPTLLRTRLHEENGERIIYITSKPSKNKADGTEVNVENEFEVEASQWDSINDFLIGLGLSVCRRKTKTGCHFTVQSGGYNVHAELLEVKYLGFFLEMEICLDTVDDSTVESSKKALKELLERLEVSEDEIEIKGYNKLLAECGHLLG